MQQEEPTVIRTDYTSRQYLTIYVDGIVEVKAQAAAVGLIGELLATPGFEGANALPVDTLESRHYICYSKDDVAEDESVPCPRCGGLMTPLVSIRGVPALSFKAAG